MEERALAGKGIVVIGGTSGLGLSAAMACARAGASVVAVGRNPQTAAAAREAVGDAGCVLVGDATEPNTAPAAIAEVLRRSGSFDGLYHVAGGSGRALGDGPLHELSDAGWDATLQLNLRSLFLSNRAAVREWLRQGRGGSVLNMASVLGFSPSPRLFATHAYAAAKAAVVGLSRAAASYYAPQGIRFNVLAPALTETPMSARARADAAVLEYIRTKQPLDGGRIGRPEDADAAVVYFLSDASLFVTGQVLCVDGGWCVSEGRGGGD
jgi:NAD(P)-dependent dehydrogenase (short-subunit alcohol dehydrogenase family)